MPQPPKSKRVAAPAGVLAAAGIALGAILGWKLSPAPASAHAPAPNAETDSIPADSKNSVGKQGAKGEKPPAAPYDTEAVITGGFGKLADFEVWLRTASCEDTVRLILSVDVGQPWRSPAVARMLAGRFREFSVDERFAAFLKLPSGEQPTGSSEAQRIFGDLAEDSLPRREKDFLALAKIFPDMSAWMMAPGLKTWAAADLPSALAFIAKMGGRQQADLTSQVLGEVAERNPQQAQEAALKLPQGDARLKALSGVARVMAKKDLGEALDWLNANQFMDRRNYRSLEAMRSVISQAAGTNPTAAAQLLLDRPGLFEGDFGQQQVQALFETWSSRDPAQAAAWLSAHPLPETYQKAADAALAAGKLAQLPLTEALASLGSASDEGIARGITSLSVRLWAEDPDHAIERMAASLPEKNRGAALARIARDLQPWQFGQMMPYLPDIGKAIEEQPHLSFGFYEFPEEQLKSIIRGLPEKAADLVRNEMLDRSFDSDPGRAVRLAADGGAEKLNPFNAGRVAVTMAQEDPDQASAWVAGIPEGENKEWAARNLVSSWAKYDPAAAAAWVQTLPPGTTRDRAALEAAKIQGRIGGTEAALGLASRIENAEARQEATGYALQTLWRQNPAQGATALAASGLPADGQTALKEKLATGGFAR